MPKKYRILEHTADIGFRAWGATPAELFENAARAMMSIAAETRAIHAAGERPVEIGGEDYESLMVNWLSEVLYLFDSDEFAPKDFHIDSIEPTGLRGRLAGEPRNPRRHPWKLIVKAVTYHEIQVAERNGRWETQVFLDI